jgi:PAS domain S-box-containing protein
MAKKKTLDKDGSTNSLRNVAEEIFSKLRDATQTLKEKTPEEIIHELQVHQIELEMQNEALREAQLALQAAHEKYIDLYELAPVGYLTVDSKGIIHRVNLTASHLLGVDRASLIGRPISRFVLKEDGDTFHLYLRHILRTREKQTCELRFVKKNGDQFYAQLEGITAQVEDGNISGSRMVITDITDRKVAEQELRNAKAGLETEVLERTAELRQTNEQLISELVERKQMEEALRESEERFRLLFERSGAVMLLIDPDSGSIVDANTAAAQYYGYPPEYLCKMRIQDINRLTPDKVIAQMQRAKMARETHFLFSHTLSTGEIRMVEVYSSTIDIQGRTLLFSIVHDITERELAISELKRSEERFRAVFEGANDFIFIKDLSFRYTHVNPATTKLFGVSESEMLGKRSEDFLPKEAAETIRELDTRVVEGESVEKLVTRVIKGAQITFHEVRVPMYNGSGEIIGICVICRDITDLNRRQYTKELEPKKYRSKTMKAVLKQAGFAASTNSVILLLGESGSGKDYLAKYIHKRSSNSSGPYFSLNCAAVPSELAESELFGYEAGAFTGANRRKRGLLELAEGGTLLLNEIGDLSPALQAKFLTFLDTRTFTRVGGQQEIRVQARILAATNRDLQQDVSDGRFRSDLYYRLNVLSIKVPPLRERMEDLPILVDELLSWLAKDLKMRSSPEFTAEDMAKLYIYHWPGNIRELRNVLERAIILSGGSAINVDIDRSGPCDAVSTPSGHSNIGDTSTLADSMQNLSRAMIEEALKRSKGKKELAASYLGVSRYTLRRWIKKLGMDVR